MAELLVRLKNNTHSDPVKDRMCYKRGDVVLVMPDGHPWGNSEGLPDFVVIRTDQTVAQMEKFCQIHEVSEVVTREVPLKKWTEEKARQTFGEFIEPPVEGTKQIRKVGKRKIATIMLTGKVLKSDTRRRWRLSETIVSSAEKTGFKDISFVRLRNSLKDKITGATA